MRTSAAPTESAYSPSGLTDPVHSVASATRYRGPKSHLSTSFPSCSARPTHELSGIPSLRSISLRGRPSRSVR